MRPSSLLLLLRPHNVYATRYLPICAKKNSMNKTVYGPNELYLCLWMEGHVLRNDRTKRERGITTNIYSKLSCQFIIHNNSTIKERNLNGERRANRCTTERMFRSTEYWLNGHSILHLTFFLLPSVPSPLSSHIFLLSTFCTEYEKSTRDWVIERE